MASPMLSAAVMRIAACLAAALPLAACAPYQPGALAARATPGDHVRRVGCLDVSAQAPLDPVIQFRIGNTCRHPVGVDFRRLDVTAWSTDDVALHPAPSDPRRELDEAVIDGHDEIRVTLDFPTPDVLTPRFCVDVSRLNVDQPSRAPIPLCFEAHGSSYLAVAPVQK